MKVSFNYAMGSNPNLERLQGLLELALTRKDWRFREADGAIRGRLPEWPAQIEAILDPGTSSRPAAIGIAIDFGSMPLGGERFRDVLNAEREMFFRSFGPFVLRQVRADSTWAPDVARDAFVIGYGPLSGISRHTSLAIFDRVPRETGTELVDRFLVEVSRFAEVGNAMASVLQRLYQRTVLDFNPSKHSHLPEAVGAQPASEPSYPWRR